MVLARAAVLGWGWAITHWESQLLQARVSCYNYIFLSVKRMFEMAQRTFTFMVSEHAKQLSAARGAAGHGSFWPSGNRVEGKPAARRG